MPNALEQQRMQPVAHYHFLATSSRRKTGLLGQRKVNAQADDDNKDQPDAVQHSFLTQRTHYHRVHRFVGLPDVLVGLAKLCVYNNKNTTLSFIISSSLAQTGPCTLFLERCSVSRCCDKSASTDAPILSVSSIVR